MITRSAQLSRLLLAPNIHFRCGDSDRRAAKGLTIKMPAPDKQFGNRLTYHPSLECSAYRYGTFGLIKTFLGQISGVEGPAENFGC